MSADNAQAAASNNASANGSKESSQSVQLFQRAHQKMVMLQRAEDQLQQLLNQRRSIQDELRGIQVQINEEFERLLRAGANGSSGSNGTLSSRLLVDLGDESAKRNGSREAEAIGAGD